MTVPDQKLDPHLEEVLRDIERDPRAQMFQTSPRQLLTGLRERSPRIGSRQAGLTLAEGELLQVHREEVAHLLCTAAKTAIVERDDPRASVGRWLTVDRRLELPSSEKWCTQAEGCLSIFPDEQNPSSASALLQRILAKSGTSLPSAYQLALASMRFVPRTATRIVIAFALIQERREESALRILQDVTRTRCLPLTKSIGLENASLALSYQGQFSRAIDALEVSRELDSGYVSSALSSFCLNLRLGDRSGAMQAGDWIASVAPAHHPAIDEFVSHKKRQTGLPEAIPTQDCLLLIPVIRDSLPTAAKRIADVYSE